MVNFKVIKLSVLDTHLLRERERESCCCFPIRIYFKKNNNTVKVYLWEIKTFKAISEAKRFAAVKRSKFKEILRKKTFSLDVICLVRTLRSTLKTTVYCMQKLWKFKRASFFCYTINFPINIFFCSKCSLLSIIRKVRCSSMQFEHV